MASKKKVMEIKKENIYIYSLIIIIIKNSIKKA